MDAVETIKRLGYSPKEFSKMTSLSLSFIRLEIARGALRVKRVGKRRLIISATEVERYLGENK